MGIADLHIHTAYSPDGTATVSAILEHVAQTRCVDLIAITDHDVIDGALEALEQAPHYGVDVVPGIEISTADGHLLALFVTKPIPAGLPLIDSVEAVAEQGGLCVAAHPGGWWDWCLQEDILQAALTNPAIAKTLVGLEEYNGSLPLLSTNRKAAAINHRLQLSTVHNSDAHMLWMIGRSATRFPGRGVHALRQALTAGTTVGISQPRPSHFFFSYLWRQALRTLGWVQMADTTTKRRIVLRSIRAGLQQSMVERSITLKTCN